MRLEAAGVHTTQDIATGLPVCLSTEGLRGCLRAAITTLANLSLQPGKFPARFKSAQVLSLPDLR